MNISKVIFYTKDFNENINSAVDVILSPQFYWIKKIDIPVKNLFQAKKIAKNMFDLEGEYIYDAFKAGDKYYVIAIEKNLNLNIDKKYIKSLRIAQKEFYEYDCIEVSDKYSIKKVDDIFFCFLNEGNCPKIDEIIKNIKFSNYTLSLDTINLDKSSLILFFISFIFIISYFIIGTVVYKKDLMLIENKKANLSKYNLPLTSFQLDAIFNDLKDIDTKQKKIKKALEIFSHTPLNNNNEEYIQLSFDKYYYVKIKTSKNLNSYYKKYFNIINSSFKNNIYLAKLAYE